MFKIFLGIVIGMLLYDLNLIPEILRCFNESGMNDMTIKTLEGLKE